jgi:hypothetical protein
MTLDQKLCTKHQKHAQKPFKPLLEAFESDWRDR